AYAQRLADRIQIHARGDVVRELALHEVRDSAGELDHFEASLDRALGVGEHLAVLVRDEERELVHVPFDQFLEPEHHPRPGEGRSLRPAGKSILCIGDDALPFGFRSEWHFGGERARRRIENVAEAAAFTPDLLAADEMGELA